MDFVIVDPERVVLYSQYGLLKRKVKELKTSEVRFISTETSWLLASLFGYGNINIFIESNYQDSKEKIDPLQVWRIHFEFVGDTENIKKKIFHIVEYAKLYDQAKQEQFTEHLTESKKEAYLQDYIGTKLQNLVGPALWYA